jgi:crotonobetainyl-CoA:carnitine CoA-transferase CaiB-like acyl-CoA transferase
LSGLRVLDLSRVWAGPLATKFLSDMGAEVIKVQPVRQFALDRRDDQSGYWHQCNGNKQAICIEFEHPEGIALFKRLVEVSDVVLDNFTPRVMRRFGVGYDTLSTLNPRLIMISCSAMGATGPEASYAALGESIEALSGIVAQTGYGDDDQPMKSGINYADPIVAMQAAAAVVAALIHRRRTGQGQFIDLSMRETTVALIGEQIVAHSGTGYMPERTGNRHPQFAPQGAYRCQGDDQWLTISVRTDDEWRRLCAAIGRPDLANDSRFVDVAGRRTHHDEIDAILGVWAQEQEARAATEGLQSAGVPAAPVLHIPDLIADPHLNARGFWTLVDEPGFGPNPYPTLPFHLSHAPVEITTPPPKFAEHNHHVFGTILGLSDDEVAKLEGEHIISPVPLPYAVEAGAGRSSRS